MAVRNLAGIIVWILLRHEQIQAEGMPYPVTRTTVHSVWSTLDNIRTEKHRVGILAADRPDVSYEIIRDVIQ